MMRRWRDGSLPRVCRTVLRAAHMPGTALLLFLAAATCVAATAAPAHAGFWLDPRSGIRFFFDEPLDLAPLEDLLQVVVRDHEVLAVDAWAGGLSREELEIGEQVLWSGCRGRVAVVLTSRRVLAFATRRHWSSIDLRMSEEPPRSALLGARVALVLTGQRLIGFESASGAIVQTDLGVREDVLDAAADTNIAVAVTNRRALGIAAFGGGFFETEIRPREEAWSLTTRANFATVATRHGLLIFRAPGAGWERRELSLR